LAAHGGRMMVAGAEATAFEIMMGRYADGKPNVDLYLNAHEGDPVRVDRAGKDRPPVIVDRPALSGAWTFQPDVISALAGHAGLRHRGLLARLLYALPTSRVGDREIGAPPVPGGVSHAYRAGVLNLWEIQERMEDGQPAPYWLHFSDEADHALRELEG